jgi:hypothetical protein
MIRRKVFLQVSLRNSTAGHEAMAGLYFRSIGPHNACHHRTAGREGAEYVPLEAGQVNGIGSCSSRM